MLCSEKFDSIASFSFSIIYFQHITGDNEYSWTSKKYFIFNCKLEPVMISTYLKFNNEYFYNTGKQQYLGVQHQIFVTMIKNKPVPYMRTRRHLQPRIPAELPLYRKLFQ